MIAPWADIENWSNDCDLEVSGWRSRTQERIVQFAQATGDFQFIHVDREREERDGPSGGPLAQGCFLLSMTPILLAERIAFPPQTIVVNYGLGKLRFAAPVRLGERFRGRFAVTGRNRIEPTETLLKVHGSIEVDGGAYPAVDVDPLIALVRYPAGRGRRACQSPGETRRQ
jgi:acyl dehydratase